MNTKIDHISLHESESLLLFCSSASFLLLIIATGDDDFMSLPLFFLFFIASSFCLGFTAAMRSGVAFGFAEQESRSVF